MPRRPMDFYETSKEAVDALVEHYLRKEFHKEASILEPCSGTAIAFLEYSFKERLYYALGALR